jgi:hypothetical protein
VTPNRETWLNLAVEIMRDGLFTPRDGILPELKISVGLPHARDQRAKTCQVFHAGATTDHIPQIFISPVVDDGLEALRLIYSTCVSLTRHKNGAGIPLLGLPKAP